ncbi:hypothetical protein Z3_89 [Bacillus phage Z3]|nr:hypothetical protein Z3_89 [Bacillus phage Z3]
MESLKEERLGEVRLNKYGTHMKIIEYNNTDDILVRFGYGDVLRTKYVYFQKRNIHSRYDKTVYGVGFLGEGKYLEPASKNSNPIYQSWTGMLKRCYDPKFHEKRPAYKDCIVCEEWHNYQNFAEWYTNNFYTVEGDTMQLDKDILFKDNKVYSPDACIFVPSRINSLFIKQGTRRGELPIGVMLNNRATINKYVVSSRFASDPSRRSSKGYATVEEAFSAYKKAKEQYIKEVALEYKERIPLDLYLAMALYEVDIND